MMARHLQGMFPLARLMSAQYDTALFVPAVVILVPASLSFLTVLITAVAGNSLDRVLTYAE